MLERLIPPGTDFVYRGSRLARWLLGIILFVKAGIALASVFNGHYAASVADGIPIDTYTPRGAQTVLALFGALGVVQLLLCAVGALILVKYQSLVPVFTLLLLLEYLARKAVTVAIPIERSGAPPGGAVNWALFGLMILAFVLSLRQSSTSRLVFATLLGRHVVERVALAIVMCGFKPRLPGAEPSLPLTREPSGRS